MEKIVNFFFEIASLRRLQRNHKQFIGAADDNIADHSHRVTLIGMVLAELEKADQNKVIKMCLLHDLAEARTGDANFLHRQYVMQAEDEARKDQFSGLPIEKDAHKLLKEYETAKTLESKVAKDADVLDQILLQQEYFSHDSKNRKIWQNHIEVRLSTKSAEQMAKRIRQTNPMEWHYKACESKTGEKIKR